MRPKLTYVYDESLVEDQEQNIIIGQPAFLEEGREQPDLFVEYSIFREKGRKELEKEFKCTFPIKQSTNIDIRTLSLNSRTLDNWDTRSEKITVEECLDKRIKGIYPVVVHAMAFFDTCPPYLPQSVQSAIKQDLLKITFLFGTEGLDLSYEAFEWFSLFSNINGLNRDNLFFFSGNLKVKEYLKGYELLTGKKDFISVEEDYHFEQSLWFVDGDPTSEITRKQMYVHFEDYSKRLLSDRIEKYFLCFNRRPHEHRIMTVMGLLANEEIKNNTIVTLGSTESVGRDPIEVKKHCLSLACNIPEYQQLQIRDILENYDLGFDLRYDIDSKFNPAASLNLEAHYKTFLNVVTETLIDERTIFFSEKIFKPIYAIQPFILIGNPYSLKKLKEMGYRTFDKWWPEDYDDEEYFPRRLQMIIEVLKEINTWDKEKVRKVYLDMEPTLVHNFFNLLNRDRHSHVIDRLLS